VINAMTKVIDDQVFFSRRGERLEREVAQLSRTAHAIGVANAPTRSGFPLVH